MKTEVPSGVYLEVPVLLGLIAIIIIINIIITSIIIIIPPLTI